MHRNPMGNAPPEVASRRRHGRLLRSPVAVALALALLTIVGFLVAPAPTPIGSHQDRDAAEDVPAAQSTPTNPGLTVDGRKQADPTAEPARSTTTSLPIFSGVVVDPAGARLAHLRLSCLPVAELIRGRGASSAAQSTNVDAHGEFALTLPGDWAQQWLAISLQSEDPNSAWAGETTAYAQQHAVLTVPGPSNAEHALHGSIRLLGHDGSGKWVMACEHEPGLIAAGDFANGTIELSSSATRRRRSYYEDTPLTVFVHDDSLAPMATVHLDGLRSLPAARPLEVTVSPVRIEVPPFDHQRIDAVLFTFASALAGNAYTASTRFDADSAHAGPGELSLTCAANTRLVVRADLPGGKAVGLVEILGSACRVEWQMPDRGQHRLAMRIEGPVSDDPEARLVVLTCCQAASPSYLATTRQTRPLTAATAEKGAWSIAFENLAAGTYDVEVLRGREGGQRLARVEGVPVPGPVVQIVTEPTAALLVEPEDQAACGQATVFCYRRLGGRAPFATRSVGVGRNGFQDCLVQDLAFGDYEYEALSRGRIAKGRVSVRNGTWLATARPQYEQPVTHTLQLAFDADGATMEADDAVGRPWLRGIVHGSRCTLLSTPDQADITACRLSSPQGVRHVRRRSDGFFAEEPAGK